MRPESEGKSSTKPEPAQEPAIGVLSPRLIIKNSQCHADIGHRRNGVRTAGGSPLNRRWSKHETIAHHLGTNERVDASGSSLLTNKSTKHKQIPARSEGILNGKFPTASEAKHYITPKLQLLEAIQSRSEERDVIKAISDQRQPRNQVEQFSEINHDEPF